MVVVECGDHGWWLLCGCVGVGGEPHALAVLVWWGWLVVTMIGGTWLYTKPAMQVPIVLPCFCGDVHLFFCAIISPSFLLPSSCWWLNE